MHTVLDPQPPRTVVVNFQDHLDSNLSFPSAVEAGPSPTIGQQRSTCALEEAFVQIFVHILVSLPSPYVGLQTEAALQRLFPLMLIYSERVP